MGESPTRKIRGVQIAAYYNKLDATRNPMFLRPTKEEVLWQKYPSQAAATRAPELFQHQALHTRGTPHPYEALRFPNENPSFLENGQPRLFNWRGNFGYRRQRWAEHWLPEEDDDGEVPEMDLDELRLFLTNRFGTLKKAFDHLDFIRNGKISAIEWQEGLFGLLYGSYGQHGQSSTGKSSKYHLSKVPRFLFNERMMKLYNNIDVDGNGEISFLELADAQGRPLEQVHAFTRRREEEKAGYEQDRSAVVKESVATESATTPVKEDQEEDGEKEDEEEGITADVREFTAFLLTKFPDLKTAFRALDTNGNGTLSAIEFEAGALSCGYLGNPTPIYRYLDSDKSGDIGAKEFKKLVLPTQKQMKRVTVTLEKRRKTKLELLELRKDGIKTPEKMKRGLCLDEMDIHCKRGPNVGSSANFYTFSRLPTRRMQPTTKFRLDQVPGMDLETFSPEHGPGYCAKGPEFFSSVGLVEHPLRGTSWKVGGARNRTIIQGPLIPSKEGREDLEKSARSWAVYEGSRVKDGHAISQVASTAMKSKKQRYGPTVAYQDFPGLVPPVRQGTFQHSRRGLRSLSEPDLR